LSHISSSQAIESEGVVTNPFGEQSLFGINRNLFGEIDASSVFRHHFGETLFVENTFHIIAGTDSGLLYQYIKACGVPKGSQYLFIELPQVLTLLHHMEAPELGLYVADGENWQQRALELDIMGYAIQGHLTLHRSLGVVHAHYGAYLPFWRSIKEAFDSFMDKQRIGLNWRPFRVRQIDNLAENQIPALCLKDLFVEKTAVVLAGGPSLNELLPWVQEHRRDLIVIAVSRISSSLLQANLTPDIIVSVDPYPINLYVSREMLQFQKDALLVNEYHLSSNLLASWGGKKVYMGKRYPWPTSLEAENLPETPGRTVTNTAVALAMDMGVSQIVLGGVDFCFSREGYTHASGSAEHALGARPTFGCMQVITNSGKLADSDHTFTDSASSLEQQAAQGQERECLFINPAPGAMRLKNVEHIPLDIIEIEPLERPATDIISEHLPISDAKTRIADYKITLGEVDRVLQELREIKNLAAKALKYNRALSGTDEKAAANNTVKVDHIEQTFKTKYTTVTEFMKHFGVQRLIPIIQHHEQNEDDRAGNNALYFLAMSDTASELIDILQRARQRILSRQEEEKPQPDMQRLFTQWREDQQMGRALQWAHHHADVVAQLPEPTQQELRGFEDEFMEYLEKLGQIYLKEIEQGIDLEGLNARAREYFQQQDGDGLLRLLEGLNAHREPEQANQYKPLVEGFLSDLNGDTETAIAHFQKTPEGPARIDALMRLFALFVKTDDPVAQLKVLEELSAISPTYTPMYADMLQDQGEIEAAVNTYTDYLLENPDDLGSMLKLGKIYQQHGEVAGVEWTMNYILDKEPENETAKAMLRSLQQAQTSE